MLITSTVNSTIEANIEPGRNEVKISGYCRCYWGIFTLDQEKVNGPLREDSDVSGFSR
jgi:hypothetical protein